MRISCPNCASQFDVDASLFPDEGREVQCSTCEHVWLQKPMKAQPLRLDAAPAATPTARMSEDEQDALRSAVAEEIDVRDSLSGDVEEADLDAGPREEDILNSLREQIAIEGGDFETKDGPAQSQRRNLRKAAEAAGVDVEPTEEAPAEKRSLMSGRGSSRPSGDRTQSKLAEALKEYEAVEREQRGGRMRGGFLAAVILCAVGLGAYLGRESITETYPPAGPYLQSYADLVDQGRDTAEDLYSQYGDPMVENIASIISSGGESAE